MLRVRGGPRRFTEVWFDRSSPHASSTPAGRPNTALCSSLTTPSAFGRDRTRRASNRCVTWLTDSTAPTSSTAGSGLPADRRAISRRLHQKTAVGEAGGPSSRGRIDRFCRPWVSGCPRGKGCRSRHWCHAKKRLPHCRGARDLTDAYRDGRPGGPKMVQVTIRYPRSMAKVLVTGMSGTGKSSALRLLSAGGHRTVDTDTDEWSYWVDLPDGSPDWIWRGEPLANCSVVTALGVSSWPAARRTRKVLSPVRPRRLAQCAGRSSLCPDRRTHRQPIWKDGSGTSDDPSLRRRGGASAACLGHNRRLMLRHRLEEVVSQLEILVEAALPHAPKCLLRSGTLERFLTRHCGQSSPARRRSSDKRPSIGTRTCSVVSRSRTVTASSSSESKSTVTHHGVPTSSWRR